MNNEIINVDQANTLPEVAEKVKFTAGEKTALCVVGVGVALLGYGIGTFVIEPIVKKGASGLSGLFKKAGNKVKNLKGKEIEDEEVEVETVIDEEVETE